jgi:hypothetical protein
MKLYRGATALFALAFLAIGVALIVLAAFSGGSAGYLLGVLFAALGLGRLYLLRRRE